MSYFLITLSSFHLSLLKTLKSLHGNDVKPLMQYNIIKFISLVFKRNISNCVVKCLGLNDHQQAKIKFQRYFL